MTDEPRRPSPTGRARRIGGAARPTPKPDEKPTPQTSAKAAEPARLAKPERAPEQAAPPPPPSAGSPARQGRGLPWTWVPSGVLGLGVLVLLVLLVVSSHGVYWSTPDGSNSARQARQQDALTAASSCFAKINTYDYRKLNGLVERDLGCVTGTFTDDLRRSLETQIIPKAPQVKATQTAQVNRTALVSVNPAGTQATVLMYGQLTQTNSTTAKKQPRVDVVGAVVTVNRVGGKWLVAKVDTDVGNPLGGS